MVTASGVCKSPLGLSDEDIDGSVWVSFDCFVILSGIASSTMLSTNWKAGVMRSLLSLLPVDGETNLSAI